MSRVAVAMLTTFGLGFMRPASGTWGSAPPVGVAAAILMGGALLHPAGPAVEPGPAAAWPGATWAIYHVTLGAICLLFSAACILWGSFAETRFHRKDPSEVVADETAGQCIPLMLLPATVVQTPLHAAATLAGVFVLFRILDIIKPWPAGRLQALPAGWGILIDDLLVGVQGLVIVQLVTRWLL